MTAGRVLRNMAASRNDFADGQAAIDSIDSCIADLAAFIGLWDESTVHGPAWRFGDLGRRIERSSVVLGLVDACLRQAPAAVAGTGAVQLEAGDVVDRAALEVLLAANESLVAYRRHHRSDVEPDAATHLLLHDLDNPRSYLASVGRLAEHVAAIDWTDGRQAVAELAGLVDDDDVLTGVGAAHAAVEDVREARRRDVVRDAGEPDRGPRPDPVMTTDRRRPCATACRTARRTRTGCRWPTATPWPTCCRGRPRSRSSRRPRSTIDPAPDERAEHIDVFGNRVLQLGVHHAHETLTLDADSEVVVEPGR